MLDMDLIQLQCTCSLASAVIPSEAMHQRLRQALHKSACTVCSQKGAPCFSTKGPCLAE